MKAGDLVTWRVSGHITTAIRYKTVGRILWIEGDRAKVEMATGGNLKPRFWKKLSDLELKDAHSE